MNFGWFMAEITRLIGCSNWLDLEFVERERTPAELMNLGVRLHLAGLSLSNTVNELENFGVQRSRKAIHDWVQKADLQPTTDASPDQIAVDEMVIGIAASSTGCTLPSIQTQTNACMYGCFQRRH